MMTVSERFAEGEGGELDLRAVGRTIWARKWWAIGPAILVAIIAAISVNLVTPRYRSEARILYDGRENVFLRPQAERSATERIAADQEALASQVQLILSRELALQVIDQLKLDKLPEFDPLIEGLSPLKRILVFLGISRNPERMTLEERVLDSYYDRVNAYTIQKSRVITVEFESADPALAAKIVNTIAEDYLRLQQKAKQEEMRASSQWLASEIAVLRQKVSDAEAKAEEFRSRNNLFVGTNNTSLSAQQLGEINTQLVNARAKKADAEARARLIREMLSRSNTIEASDIVNSELVRRLSEQRVALRAQLAEQYSTLLDAHPRIKELKAQLADLDRQIRAEAEKLVRTLENDAKIADAQVSALNANLDMVKRQAASTSEDDVRLRALEREARAQRELLESYLAKYRETSARENLASAPPDARIISRGIVSNTPYFPKKFPIVLIATLAALVLSLALIATSALMRASAAAPTYGPAYYAPGHGQAFVMQRLTSHRMIDEELSPHMAADSPPVAADAEAPGNTPSHPLRAEATSIDDLANKLRDGGTGHCVPFFRLAPDAGASLAAIAAARLLARDWLVVLVRLEPGLPDLPNLIANPNAPGVTDLVAGKASFGEVIGRDRLSRAHVIPHGSADISAADVVESKRFVTMINALTRTYDHVIVDAGLIDRAPVERLAENASRAVLVTAGTEDAEATPAQDRLTAAGYSDLVVLVEAPQAAPQPEAA
ncbi:MAG: exopolysaccharide transport family protein [Xanthobacteraceae bacterium]